MIEIRLAKPSDKRRFLQLALERDRKAWNTPSGYYPSFRNAAIGAKYWGPKFNKLVKSKRLLVACINRIPVGFLYFTFEFIDYPAAYVELIFVSKSGRRQGIATSLLKKFEQVALEKGFSKVFSSTNPSNRISLKLHKKLDYNECGFIYGIESKRSKEIFLSKELKAE